MKKLKEYFNKNFLSLISVILIVFVFFLFIGLPLREAGGQNTIQKIYFADDITDAHQKIINKYNEINAGRIEVIPIDLPFNKFTTNERKELLTRAFRSKSDKIDVFSVDYIWVPRFAKWAEPISENFETAHKNRILKYALNSCYFNGQLVAVPLKIDVGTMYFRKDLIEHLPNYKAIEKQILESITWDELIKLQRKINIKKDSYFIYPADDYEGLVCNFFEMILNQDRTFFERGELLFNSKEPRIALNLLRNLIHKYKISPPEIKNYNEMLSCQHYVKNDGLFIRYWPEFLIDYNKHFFDPKKEPEFIRAPLPHFKGTKNASVFGGWNLMVSKFSNNKKASMDFIKYLISEEAQNIFLEGDVPPVLNTFYNNTEKYIKNKFLNFYKKLFDSGVYRPSWVEYTRISDIVAYNANKAISGEMTVDEALTNIDEMIKKQKVIIR